MNSACFAFLEPLEKLLYVEMGKQTSACLYGSAVAGEWVAARSDLDLLIWIPENRLGELDNKLRAWRSKRTHPILDGYALSSSGTSFVARELHALGRVERPATSFIPLIDLWNAKNRSIQLFGDDLKGYLPEISQENLKIWAIKDIKGYWIPTLEELVSRSDLSSKAEVPLSTMVWLASGVGRMLILAQGTVCSSKPEALRWLANENGSLREVIDSFIVDFEKPDDLALKLPIKNAVEFGASLLGLLTATRH